MLFDDEDPNAYIDVTINLQKLSMHINATNNSRNIAPPETRAVYDKEHDYIVCVKCGGEIIRDSGSNGMICNSCEECYDINNSAPEYSHKSPGVRHRVNDSSNNIEKNRTAGVNYLRNTLQTTDLMNLPEVNIAINNIVDWCITILTHKSYRKATRNILMVAMLSLYLDYLEIRYNRDELFSLFDLNSMQIESGKDLLNMYTAHNTIKFPWGNKPTNPYYHTYKNMEDMGFPIPVYGNYLIEIIKIINKYHILQSGNTIITRDICLMYLIIKMADTPEIISLDEFVKECKTKITEKTRNGFINRLIKYFPEPIPGYENKQSKFENFTDLETRVREEMGKIQKAISR